MNSNSGQSSFSDDGDAYELPIDNCNHLISTSLRDLGLKYKELSHEQADPIDLTKENKTFSKNHRP
ncbi:MAG: hypothetical protein K9K40_08900 [Desulfotignum sp.]|nr:hypothetical protein [Desulfotignum sp.]